MYWFLKKTALLVWATLYNLEMLIDVCCASENARVQEDAAGVDLSHLEHDTAQLPVVDRHIADVLLRVRGAALGNSASGRPLLGVWRQVPREVQGPPERGLLAE